MKNACLFDCFSELRTKNHVKRAVKRAKEVRAKVVAKDPRGKMQLGQNEIQCFCGGYFRGDVQG